jgi:hypothetical protein
VTTIPVRSTSIQRWRPQYQSDLHLRSTSTTKRRPQYQSDLHQYNTGDHKTSPTSSSFGPFNTFFELILINLNRLSSALVCASDRFTSAILFLPWSVRAWFRLVQTRYVLDSDFFFFCLILFVDPFIFLYL